MEWKREFEIGHEAIDAQHQELFAHVGGLLAAIAGGRQEQVGPALQFLHRYVLDHFAAEQGLMAAAGYPQADAHAAEHARFAKDLLALETQRGGNPGNPWLASKLAVGLASWLRQHVLGADRELGRFLRAQGERSAAE
ncbi:bacteriohemerythrin [Anaeromyxobacter diazotrophicus]|nr:hemerythrin family protein [Anaeromyxobacter diazotrophicus]